MVWVHHNAPSSDFISVVLIRTFPGALSRLICGDFAHFVLLRPLRGVNSYDSSAKLDSLKIISGAAFCIIGLTKIPKNRISSARLDLPFYLNNYGT